MRPAASIKPHLSDEELRDWLHETTDRASYQRRLAIWMTHHAGFHAQKVADLLQVAQPSVWKWIGEYNRYGPAGLERSGRGGRRWAFLGWAEEQALLEEWHTRAARGDVLTAKHMADHVRTRVGRAVSLAYVYRLLQRHGWRKVAPRHHHVNYDPAAQEAYKKTAESVGRSGCRPATSCAHPASVPRRRTLRPHQ